MRLGIVGAGPGGLVASIAARRAGLEVTLFERAPALRPVGVALVIQTNGLRVLRSLEIEQRLRPILQPLDAFMLRRPAGRPLMGLSFDSAERFAAAVMRSELHEALAAQARALGVDIELDMACTAVTASGELRFEDGTERSFDVIVGSDGINSVVRDAVAPGQRARSLGWAALRGVVDVEQPDRVATEIWGPGGRLFGWAPLPRGRTYFYCTAPDDWSAIANAVDEGWLASWSPFGPQVTSIMRAVNDWTGVTCTDIADIRLPRWHRGSILLLGDAAHAMAPNVGQGANSAMVDALVLIKLLSQVSSGALPFGQVGPTYESVRKRFVGTTQRAARLAGVLPRWRKGPLRVLIDAAMGAQQRIPAMRSRGDASSMGINPRDFPYFDS